MQDIRTDVDYTYNSKQKRLLAIKNNTILMELRGDSAKAMYKQILQDYEKSEKLTNTYNS